jgi:hypothetical protein
MEVKIFSDSYVADEKKINKWLKKENPDIKFIRQSESMDDGIFNFTISIWYEPKEQKKAGTF